MKTIALLIGVLSLSLFSFIADPELVQIYIARTQMAFNRPNTAIEAYIFTDWKCPKCKQFNSMLAKNASSIHEKTKLYFIDLNPDAVPVLTKANEMLLLNKNKNLSEYLQIRDKLFDLAEQSTPITDEMVKSALKPYGIDDQPPPKELLESGIVFFKTMKNNFDIQQTPSILIYDLTQRKSEKFEGEILSNPATILDSILRFLNDKTPT